jgi:subtilisin family serine protease
MSRLKRVVIAYLIGCLVVALLPLGLRWGPAAGAVSAAPALETTPDQLLITFQPGLTAAERDDRIAQRGGLLVKWFAGIDTALVAFPAGGATTGAVRSFATDTLIRAVEPNARIYPSRLPDDPQSPLTAAALDQISAPAAWETTTGSRDVDAPIVGVVDSGVDYDHPDLSANIWSAPEGWNLEGCGPGTHGYRFDPGGSGCDPIDEYGHGTHVAGTIGAVGNNSIGSVGVSWQTRIMALRVFDAAGYGDTAGAIAAIEYAVEAKRRGEPVHILNISWTTPTYVQALYGQIRAASAADILVVAAAGNAGLDNAATPVYPANFGTHASGDPFPAALPNVIAVAATSASGDGVLNVPGPSPNEQNASNYSATRVDLAAPGEAIYSTFPGDDYDYLSGTSMAAPFVSGAAALLLAALLESATEPQALDATSLRARLRDCGAPIGALADKTISGKRLDIARAISGADSCADAPTYPLAVETADHATVATLLPSPAPTAYPYGAVVELSATAEPGYQFANWLVNGKPAGTAATLSVSMMGPRSISAVTVPIDAKPEITLITPAGTPMRAAPLTVTVEGDNFLPRLKAYWQVGADAEPTDWHLVGVTYLSSKRLRIEIPTELLDEPLDVQLRITNPDLSGSELGATAWHPFAVQMPQAIALGAVSTVPTWANFGLAPFTIDLSASSNLPVRVTTNGICSAAPSGSGATLFSVTILRAGRCEITATQAGDTMFAPAEPLIEDFVIYKASQSIMFEKPADRTLGAAPFTLVAQASSGLPVQFSSTTTTICTLNGNTLMLVGVGICEVSASQHGNGNFEQALVTRSFVISAPPTPTFTPTPLPPTPTPTAVPIRHTLTVTTSGNGTVAASASGAVVAGTIVILTARPGGGQLFLGWSVDGIMRSYASSVQVTVDRDRTVMAEFAPQPSFADVPDGTPAGIAIEALAARRIIRGCDQTAGLFCPDDSTLRAQMAALIVRTMGWGGEAASNPFPDRGLVDDELWRSVGILAARGVARGYGDGTYDPTGEVLAGQTISFITRAMVQQDYWQLQPDNPALYPNVPALSGHRQDVATYLYYVNTGVPDLPNTRGDFTGWDQPSSRAWFARALWAALQSHFGATMLP